MRQKTRTAYIYEKFGSGVVVRKTRVGRFQITVMRFRIIKTAANVSQRDFIPEVELTRDRICVQHAVYDKSRKNFRNQQIWLNDNEELEQLQEALNEFLCSASDEEAPVFYS